MDSHKKEIFLACDFNKCNFICKSKGELASHKKIKHLSFAAAARKAPLKPEPKGQTFTNRNPNRTDNKQSHQSNQRSITGSNTHSKISAGPKGHMTYVLATGFHKNTTDAQIKKELE